MAGYIRQNSADITSGSTVRAAPINSEFNQVRDAFSEATGHKHDGTSAEGPIINMIGDSGATAINKVQIDETNNKVSFYSNVNGGSVAQVHIADGKIEPETDNDIDLGSSAKGFKNLYLDGTANVGSISAATATISGGSVNGTAVGASTPSTGAFTTVSSSGQATLASADINGGTVDNSIIGASTPAAASFTTVSSSGQATLNSADINGGTIDGSIIGASTAAAASFTTISSSGQATLASADINGGTIDGAVIGGATPAAVTGTTVTANNGFNGVLSGNVTGNLTGNVTGNLTGDVTGDVTGNLTASSGTTTVNNLTVNGTVDFTNTALTNLAAPSNASDAATKSYVDTEVSNLVDSAPGALNTLNELATALGDDANFSTTITNSVATKLPLAGGTMTGDIAMGSNTVTGLAAPSSGTDAATKTYVDTATASNLAKAGGTMTGALAMSSNKITGLGTPTATADATTKGYVDAILGSTTAASDSATNAATSETNAGTSATNAANSATAAAASFDAFDDKFLGSKNTSGGEPTVDNDGDALSAGVLYWDNTNSRLRIYNGSAWESAAVSAATIVEKSGSTMTGDLAFGDNDKAIFGAGSNLQIFYDGTDSIIKDNGSGDLIIQANDFSLQNATGAYTYLSADVASASVKLYFGAGNEKLATTSTGVDVTGTAKSDIVQIDAGSAPTWDTNTRLWTESGFGARYDGYQHRFDVGVGRTQAMSINASGNVGIGTTSISGKLSINGEVYAAAGSASGVAYGFYPKGTYGNTGMFSPAANTVAFATTGGERMRIDSSGNVGIGTNAPAALMHLKQTTGNAILRINSDSGERRIDFGDSTDDDGGRIKYDASDNMLLFTNGSERLRISGSNVGIGTSSPVRPLHVAGTTNAFIRIEDTDNNADTDGLIGGLEIRGADSQNAGIFQFSSTANRDIDIGNETSTGALDFRTNSTQRMRIDSSGNVGIGTVSPSQKLHVSGSVTANNYFISPSAGTVGTANDTSIEMRTSADGTPAMIFRANGSSQRMQLDAGGKLNVNNTTGSGRVNISADNWPENALALYSSGIAGQTNFAGMGFFNQDADSPIGQVADIYTNPTGTLSLTASGNPAIQLKYGSHGISGGTPALTVDNAGSIGIGTTSPSETLHVEEATTGNAVRVSRGGNYIVMGGSGSGTQYVKGYEGTIAFGNAFAGNTTFLTNDIERLRITSAGDIGIGRSDPQNIVGNHGGGLVVRSAAGRAASTTLFCVQSIGSNSLLNLTEAGEFKLRNSSNTQTLLVDTAGSLTATGNVTAYSDERLKSDITTIDGALDKVQAMRGVTFTKDGEAGSGVIAQEMEKIAPELVMDGEEYKSVAYGNLVGYLIEAVKELSAKVEALENGSTD